MTLRSTSFMLFFLIAFSSKSQDRELPADVKTIACFRTHSSILPTNKLVPQVKIIKGTAIVFDYVREKGDNSKIISGDTFVTHDSDFFERVTFAATSKADTFYYSGASLKLVNGFYEFHGGEAPLANTDFRIKKGFIKGHKVNGSWIIEALISVVDKQNSDKTIREIKFIETFKNCK